MLFPLRFRKNFNKFQKGMKGIRNELKEKKKTEKKTEKKENLNQKKNEKTKKEDL